MAKSKKSKSKSVVSTEYEYETRTFTNAAGRKQVTRGLSDAVANATLAFFAGGGTLEQIVRDNKLQDKYADMASGNGNAGTRRMSVGNSLRALVRAGTPVKIGNTTVTSLTQRVARPK